MRWLLCINLLFLGDIKAVQITSLNGNYRNKSNCPNLVVHFNYTQQKDSFTSILITNSYNHTFPRANCSMVTNYSGICNVNNLYYNSGEMVKISILEFSSNGAVLQTDSRFIRINFTMIFGPLTNISKDVRNKNFMYISYDTLDEDCYKNEKIEKIELEQCFYDQEWVCSQVINSDWLYFGCKKATSVSIYQNCLIKIMALKDNFQYRFRLRYSVGFNGVFSAWSDYLYHSTKSKVPKIPPTFKCILDKEKNSFIKIIISKPTNDDLSENYTHFLLNIMGSDSISEKKIPVTSEMHYSISEEIISGKSYKVSICTSKGCSQSIEPQCFFNNSKYLKIISITTSLVIVGVVIVGIFILVKWRNRHRNSFQDQDIQDNFVASPDDIVLPRQREQSLVPYSVTRFNAEDL